MSRDEELGGKAPPCDKSTWGDGPWQHEPDRIDFVHAGLPCLALRHPDYGSWCGYVGVQREHPYYGKHPLANSMEVSAHWGLNYGHPCQGYICHVPEPGTPDDVWWLGWDFNHAFDFAPAMHAREQVIFRNHPELLGRDWMEVYRDLPYVRANIEKVAEELAVML
jgi:hypothetical protein